MFDILNLGWTPPLPRDGNKSWLYPIMIMLGFAVAIALACIKMWKRYKIKIEPFYWFVLIGVPTAIIGANFGSCVLDSFWRIAGSPGGTSPGKPWSEFFTNFGQGLAIEWGVIFTIIVALIYFPLILKKDKYKVRDEFGPKPEVHQVSTWLYFDAVMPCILIAQFLGRWGNYFNQEVYGAEVFDQGLINFLQKFLPGMEIKAGHWYQPLFLWEGIGNLVMFFVLYFGVEFIKQRKAGDMSACYLIWYGVFRACLEPLRDQQFKSTSSIVLSAIFAFVGILFIVCNHIFCEKIRKHKAWKTLFSSFGGQFVTYLFSPKGNYELKLDKLTKKVKRYEQQKETYTNELNAEHDASKKEVLQNKINILFKKIDDCQQRIINLEKIEYDWMIKQQNKVTTKCQYKIDNLNERLNNQLTNDEDNRIIKKREKATQMIYVWENRKNASEKKLLMIQQKAEDWSLPEEYIRNDSQRLYYRGF